MTIHIDPTILTVFRYVFWVLVFTYWCFFIRRAMRERKVTNEESTNKKKEVKR